MIKNIRTEIKINATQGRAWKVLTDFESYQNWNPIIKDVNGEPVVGNKIGIIIKPPNAKAMNLKPEILTFEIESELRWKGAIGHKYLFEGNHYFILEKIDENTTKFIHGEDFTGILIPFLGKILDNTKNAYLQMNEAFKNQCEK